MSRDDFQPTSWSLLERAVSETPESRQAALSELAGRYWRPVYAYLRRRGCAADEAADQVQAFFCYLLEKELLGRADPARGRFRGFLLGVLRRFQANARRKKQILPLEPSDLEGWLSGSELTPERAFERQWALDLLGRALDGLAAELGEQRWAVLREHLAPTGAPPAYEDSAGRLGLSVAAFTSALHRGRRRLGELVREEAGEELDELFSAL